MPGEKCPFLSKKCIKHDCALYTHLLGMIPQTSQPTDSYGCALAFLPILLVENANMTRQNIASSDKVANEVAKHHATFLGAMPEELRMRLINSNPKMIPRNGDGNV